MLCFQKAPPDPRKPCRAPTTASFCSHQRTGRTCGSHNNKSLSDKRPYPPSPTRSSMTASRTASSNDKASLSPPLYEVSVLVPAPSHERYQADIFLGGEQKFSTVMGQVSEGFWEIGRVLTAEKTTLQVSFTGRALDWAVLAWRLALTESFFSLAPRRMGSKAGLTK